MMNKPTILHSDPDLSVATLEHSLVCVWHGDTTTSGVSRITRELNMFSASHPRGFGLITLVEAKASMPETAERNAIAELLRSFGEKIAASALIFEGEGFRAAAVRSVVAGLNLLARQPYPHKVFGTSEEASNWLAPTLAKAEIPVNPHELNRTLTDLRGELSQRRGRGN